MPDAIGNKTAHDYHLDVPAPEQGFFAKGLGHGDWGAKNRLSHLFNPKSGNTVMLAFDHGYIMGATAGLERMDVTIAPLCRYADVLMATRGAIRSCIPPTVHNAICLRATHDASVLIDDMSTGNGVGADMEAAIRMNASAVAIQCFIGGGGPVPGDPVPRRGRRGTVRHPCSGRHRRGQGDGPHHPVFPAGRPDAGRAGGVLRQDLLLR